MKTVLLTKRFPLGFYLQQRLAERGYFTAVVYEHPNRQARLKRIKKQHGILYTADFLAFQLFDRALRARHFNAALEETLGQYRTPPNLPELDVPTVNSAEARQFIAVHEPDALIVHATGLLTPETFQLAPRAINLHCGVLPQYRGHDSVFWALAKGDRENIGATIHLIDKGADTGAILDCCRIQANPADTDITLWLRAFRAGVDGLLKILDQARFEGSSAAERHPHYPHRGLTDHLRYLVRSSPKR